MTSRGDNRSRSTMRPIALNVGVVSQASGSAYIEIGNTKVICAVYGPREITGRQGFSVKGRVFCQFKFAPFSCKGSINTSALETEEKELSLMLQEALEPVICLHMFPKAKVDVFITVLENDGSALAHSITAAGAALVDAGIDIYGVVAGCSLIQNGDHILLDPTEEEEKAASNFKKGSVVLGYMPSQQQLVTLLQDGQISAENLSKAVNILQENCCKIYSVIENVINNARTK